MMSRKPSRKGTLLYSSIILIVAGLFVLPRLLAWTNKCSSYEVLSSAPSYDAYRFNNIQQLAGGKVVLITGAAGLIGSHVAATCLQLGMTVIAVDDLSHGSRSNVPQEATFVKGDVRDADFVKELFDEYDFEYVYHLAGYMAAGLPHSAHTYTYRNSEDHVSSVSILDQAVRAGTVKCFVFTSSIAVYGAGKGFTEDSSTVPEDPYGISKYAVELDLKAAHKMFGLNHIIFRAHNVYGPGQNMFDHKYRNVVGTFLSRLMTAKPITIFGDGYQTRKFSYIDDVAWPLAIAPLFDHNYNQVFNVGSDTAYTLKQLADMAVTAWNAAGAEVVHKEARNEARHAESSHDKLRCFLPALPPPVPLPQGLERMVAWVRQGSWRHAPEEPAANVGAAEPSELDSEGEGEGEGEGEDDSPIDEEIVEQNMVSLQTGAGGGYTERQVCGWRSPSSMSRLDPARRVPDAAVEAADRFQQYLCQMQGFEQDAHRLVVVFADDGQGDLTHCGIGCRYLRQTMAFWHTLHDRGMMASPPLGEWTYTDEKRCSARNDECYFQPLTSRPVHEMMTESAFHVSQVLASTRTGELMKAHADDYVHRGVRLFTRTQLDAFRFHDHFGIPWLSQAFGRESASAGHTGCWVAAQLLYYMLQPNKDMDAVVAKEKKRLKWDEGDKRCVAVHVRHGWRAASNAALTMADFMKSVKRAGIKRVLIMTEDQAVIDDAEKNFPDYTWMYTEYPRENTYDIGVAMAKGEMDQTAEAHNAFINLLLSSECNYFVGRSSSTWFRLMLLLAYGKYGTMPPFDNLSEDWGHGGLRKWGFLGTCTLPELKKEVRVLMKQHPKLVKMDLNKIYCRGDCEDQAERARQAAPAPAPRPTPARTAPSAQGRAQSVPSRMGGGAGPSPRGGGTAVGTRGAVRTPSTARSGAPMYGASRVPMRSAGPAQRSRDRPAGRRGP